MLFDAIEFAAHAHRGQYRKGTSMPYVFHVMRVSQTVLEAQCREAVAVAALLHDVLEDTAFTYADLEVRFGPEVAALVYEVTELERTWNWRQRKSETIRKHDRTTTPEAVWIALADKLDNIRSIRKDLALIGPVIWDHFNAPPGAQKWYYVSLLDVFRRRALYMPGLSPYVELYGFEVDIVFRGIELLP